MMLNADVKEFQFKSEHDSLELHAVIAVPSGNINGIVQIVHGMCEYKEKYFPLMDYLASEGFISVIHDNRGHGKSVASPDDLGFFYKDGDIGFVKDIKKLMDIVKEVYPDKPYFLIGHSLGSLATRVFIKDYDDEINGLFILGCPCYTKFSKFASNINSSLNKKLGSRYRSEKIYTTFNQIYNKRFIKETLKNSWVSSNKEYIKEFNDDPLCNYIYTLNGYESILKLFKETYSKKDWQVKNPHLPIRFLSGKDDPLMLTEKKFFEAVSMFEKLGYDSVSHRLFEGMRHGILNETNNDIVFKDIAKTLFSWIDRLYGATDVQ